MFHHSMRAIWEELCQVGLVSQSTACYNNTESGVEPKGRAQEMSQGPPVLLPVSFSLAKDWLPKQQKAQSEALETGAVNEEAREVVANPNCSLAEQPASTAALLERPARPASPVVPPPVMSLGLEPVTDQVRAKEQAEE